MAWLYVSGPMRGIKDFNRHAFHAAAEVLQAAGHEVFDPAAHDEVQGFDLTSPDGLDTPVGFDLREALGADMAWITAHANGVAVLSGWTGSKGAKAEVATAEALGLPVESVDYWVGLAGRDAEWTDMGGEGVREASEYVPAIGDRVRIVDADYIDPEREYVGVIRWADGNVVLEQDHGRRAHPISITLDNGSHYCAVEVELIETAAEMEQYAEACAEFVAEEESARALDALREKFRAIPPEKEWLDDRTYITDGEVRVTSSTGGAKGRKLQELGGIDPAALLTLAEVSGMGARKYDTWNYLKGYDWSLSFNAMQRHALAFWAGQDNDDESGLPHVAHAAWHCLALLAFLQRDIGTDDRFKQEGV